MSVGIPGLKNQVKTTCIFVGSGDNREPWYTLSGTKDAPIKLFLKQSVFQGRLVEVKVKEVLTKKGLKDKLDLKFSVTEEGVESFVVIRSGLGTVFSRCFLLKLSNVDFDIVKKKPLTLTAWVSDQEEKVVFCALELDGKKLSAPWDKETDLKELANVIDSLISEELETKTPAEHNQKLNPHSANDPDDEVDFADMEIPF